MVIQRIQSLWLLIAAIFMVFVGVQPFAYNGGEIFSVNNFPVLAILNWLTVPLLVFDIFLFKNLRLQKMVSLVALIVMVAQVLTTYIIIGRCLPECDLSWWGGPVFIVFAALFDLMAYRGMRRDHKKLRNSDRLWS